MPGPVLVIANAKGGVGKTTSAVCLASLLDMVEPTLLIDADYATQSAEQWWHDARDDGDPLGPSMTAVSTPDELRASAEGHSGPVVVDLGPGDSRLMSAAMSLSGAIVIVPSRPGRADLARVGPTLALVRSAGAPGVVLLTMANEGRRLTTAALGALEDADIPVLETTIPHRVAFELLPGTKPPLHILERYRKVWRELREALPERTGGE